MENRAINPANVTGWGVDADPQNNPTYPLKKRTASEHAGYTWERPPAQSGDIEILHSNERPNLTAVYGTSTPPAGLSGMIRRLAFRYSESSYGHWLPLMLADRVGVLEGLLEDVARGRVPNIPAELGWNAEWKYNRRNLISRTILRVAVLGAAIAYFGSANKYPRRRTHSVRTRRRLFG